MQYYETYEDNNNFYLRTELCDGGELIDKIAEDFSIDES
jgi:hypothetical protein